MTRRDCLLLRVETWLRGGPQEWRSESGRDPA